jgi:hypothetical protein
MKVEKYVKIAAVLTSAGVLFSGYLSGIKLFSGTCAFNESCPTFLGYPACYFGFIMFTAMFIGTVAALIKKVAEKWPMKLNLGISLLGIIFAGSFAVREIAVWFQPGQFRLYGLGLSTCVYGLVFYIIIFVFTLTALLKKEVPAAPSVAPTVPAAPPQA